MNNQCANCGAEIKEGYKFCHVCGQKIELPEQNEEIQNLTESKTFCVKCGKEMDQSWKLCPYCGWCEEEHRRIPTQNKMSQCPNCGNELKIGAKFCPKCGTKREVDLNPCIDSAKNAAVQYANIAKEKSQDFVGDLKNYKQLSQKKKKKVIATLSGIVAAVIIVFVLLGGGGVSDEVVANAALNLAEEDYGYQLELTSYDVFDSFNASATNGFGTKLEAKMYLVIIEANAKDANGKIVDTVTYGGIIGDPRMSDGYAVCNTLASSVKNFTDYDTDTIKDNIRESAASVR